MGGGAELPQRRGAGRAPARGRDARLGARLRPRYLCAPKLFLLKHVAHLYLGGRSRHAGLGASSLALSLPADNTLTNTQRAARHCSPCRVQCNCSLKYVQNRRTQVTDACCVCLNLSRGGIGSVCSAIKTGVAPATASAAVQACNHACLAPSQMRL